MAELSISAIICTHNRDQYLAAAIDSLLAQTLHDIEVIVVDNASTDTTAEVVQMRLSDPRLRYVYEPTLGLSIARNTGQTLLKAILWPTLMMMRWPVLNG